MFDDLTNEKPCHYTQHIGGIRDECLPHWVTNPLVGICRSTRQRGCMLIHCKRLKVTSHWNVWAWTSCWRIPLVIQIPHDMSCCNYPIPEKREKNHIVRANQHWHIHSPRASEMSWGKTYPFTSKRKTHRTIQTWEMHCEREKVEQ